MKRPNRSWLDRLSCRFYGKWPKRRVRPLLRLEITNDLRKAPFDLNHQLRARGYTGGDRVVVLLERDFEHIAQLAHTKVKSPMHAFALYMLASSTLSPDIRKQTQI